MAMQIQPRPAPAAWCRSLTSTQLSSWLIRDYFETILLVIEADGMAGTCDPLTRFCLAAITVGQGQVLAVRIVAPAPPGWHVVKTSDINV